MKKRVLALMLVLGMTFSLAACGSSNDKKSDDTKTETTDKGKGKNYKEGSC